MGKILLAVTKGKVAEEARKFFGGRHDLYGIMDVFTGTRRDSVKLPVDRIVPSRYSSFWHLIATSSIAGVENDGITKGWITSAQTGMDAIEFFFWELEKWQRSYAKWQEAEAAYKDWKKRFKAAKKEKGKKFDPSKFEAAPPKPLGEKPGIARVASSGSLGREGWKIIRDFEIFRIEGTGLVFLKAREKNLGMFGYKYADMKKDEVIQSITLEELEDWMKKNPLREKRNGINMATDGQISVYAEMNSDAFFDLIPDMADAVEEEEQLPPLAPPTPMQWASIMIGGLKFGKRLQDEVLGEILIKGAPIEIETESVRHLPNGRVETTTARYRENMLAVYSIDRRELEIY